MSLFLFKLKQKIAEIETLEKVGFPPEPVQEGTLYNIHKRTLPVRLDTPVMFGLTRDEANKAIAKFTASEARLRNTNRTYVVYYDAIPQDATQTEKSVYYNSTMPVIGITNA